MLANLSECNTNLENEFKELIEKN